MSKVYIDSDVKLNIRIVFEDGTTIGNNDFYIELFCTPRKVLTITKAEAKKVNAETYKVMFNTGDVGVGELACRVVAEIADTDFPDKLRKTVKVINTGISIVR